jgi:predicted dehydrogenase
MDHSPLSLRNGHSSAKTVRGSAARVKVEEDKMGPTILQCGYGAFGMQHARAWAALGHEARLVIADPSEAARAAAQKAHPGASVVADHRPLLGARDQICDIVAPSDINAGLAMAALGAGHDVFIEKPVGRDVAEAERLAVAAADTDRSVQVGFVLRFHPLARRMHAILAAGRLGRLRWIGGEFLCLKRPRRDAGVVLNDAVHFLDLILWLKGAPPRGVQAMLADGLGRGFEDLVSVQLDWDDGTLGRLDASCVVAGEVPDPFAPPGAWSRKCLDLAGDAGRLSADFGTGDLRVRAARQMRDETGWHPVVGPSEREMLGEDSITPLLAAEFQAFLDSRAARTPPAPGLAAGIAVAAVCDAIFAAARERRRVEVRVS